MRVATLARVLGAGAGAAGSLGSIGVRFMVGGDGSGGGYALVEHPMPPPALGAPLHRHSREDEYSDVREGRVGAQLGEEVVLGTDGDLIFKPRGQWHTCWNAGNEPARLLKFVSLGGVERYFAAVSELPLAAGPPDLGAIAAVAARFGLELDFASVARLLQEHGLTLGVGAPKRRLRRHGLVRSNTLCRLTCLEDRRIDRLPCIGPSLCQTACISRVQDAASGLGATLMEAGVSRRRNRH